MTAMQATPIATRAPATNIARTGSSMSAMTSGVFRPALRKAPTMVRLTALSRSASSMTTMGFFPPISSWTRFIMGEAMVFIF